MAGIATLSDVETIETIPLAERNLPPTTYAALQRGAAIDPERTALTFFLQGTDYKNAVRYNYGELLENIHQTANLFHALGIGPEDVLSMILPNLPQAHFTIWGGEAAGIVNPINPLLEPEVMAEIMRAAETKVLVTLAPFPGVDVWPKVATIVDEVPTLETILQVNLGTFLSGPKKYLAKVLALRTRGQPVQARVLDFDRYRVKQPAGALVNEREIGPDDIAAYFHTGGTTGTPKIARHTHFNEVYDAWAAAQSMEITPEKELFCGLPLFHVNAVIVTGMLPWMHGAGLVLGTPQGYRGDGVFANFWQIVEYYSINFFSGVPTVYSMLLDVPIGDSHISSLEFAICGAAPMPVEVFQAFEERTNLRILEGYGLTEGTCVSAVNPPLGERRIGSIGYRLPYQEMKVVREDGEGRMQECAPDEIGLVVVRGPNVFPGYKEEVHNERAWVDLGGGAPWLNTGDLGRQDADGYFWLTGREKELIIRGGHNIDPQLIEGPLHEHPDVVLAAAVGRPDARVGELPVAYVQLKPGASTTAEALLDFARENIGERAAVPKTIHVMEEVPQTAVGKIFKPALVQREVEGVYRQAVSEVEGVAEVTVKARPDRIHGIVAEIVVTVGPGAGAEDVRAEVARALGHYTIYYDLDIAS